MNRLGSTAPPTKTHADTQACTTVYIYISQIVVYVLLIWNVMKDVFGCRTELKPNLLLQRIKVYFSILNNTVRVSDFKHWLGTPLASARFQKSYRKLTGRLTWSLENTSAPPTSFLCNISTWKHWKGQFICSPNDRKMKECWMTHTAANSQW